MAAGVFSYSEPVNLAERLSAIRRSCAVRCALDHLTRE